MKSAEMLAQWARDREIEIGRAKSMKALLNKVDDAFEEMYWENEATFAALSVALKTIDELMKSVNVVKQ